MTRLSVNMRVTMPIPPMRAVMGVSTSEIERRIGRDRPMLAPGDITRGVESEPITVARLHAEGMSPATLAQSLRDLADDIDESFPRIPESS